MDEPARPNGPAIIHGRKTRRVSRGALSRCKKLGVSKSEQTELRARPDVSAPLGVGAPGLEPGTSALSGPRSNQLSYAPHHAHRCRCLWRGHTSSRRARWLALCPRRSAQTSRRLPAIHSAISVSIDALAHSHSPAPKAPLPGAQPLAREFPGARCPSRTGSPRACLTGTAHQTSQRFRSA